jgi:hypothetical protein
MGRENGTPDATRCWRLLYPIPASTNGTCDHARSDQEFQSRQSNLNGAKASRRRLRSGISGIRRMVPVEAAF